MNNQTCKVYHWCKPGVVYIAKHQDVSIYKIGCTTKATRQAIIDRLGSLRRTWGQQYNFCFTVESACAKGLERAIHEHLRDKQVDTEMFSLSDEDLQEIAMISTFEGKPTRSWR